MPVFYAYAYRCVNISFNERRNCIMATLTLDYWEDDSWYVGRLREVPGCFSQGETLEELERNIKEVYRLLKL